MSDKIVVNYDVMDRIILDINGLADRTEAYTHRTSQLGKSKGSVATELGESSRCLGEFAAALCDVMRETATLLQQVEDNMRGADSDSNALFDVADTSDSSE